MGINQRLYMIMQAPFLVSRSNISLDPIAGLLKRCLKFKALRGGKQVHAWLVTRGTDSRILSLNSKLVGMYASCGDLKSATLVFKRIRNPNVFALNWMVLASAFEGYYKEAIWFFCSMKDSVFIYNKYTFSVVLKAFVGLLDLNKGKEVHCMVKQLGFESDVCVANALVDMYGKCGCIGYARRVFDRMVKRDIVSWTSMISGYCNVKKIEEALILFERMRLEGLEPNDFTWNVLISGYARRGDSDGAFSLLSKMTREGLVPDLVTWNAMIAGFVQGERAGDAFKLFQDMLVLGVKPNLVTVAGLLPACGMIISIQRDDVTRGDLKKPGSFAMLSAIYATSGEGREVRYNMKKIVEERKAQKEPAFSQVEEKDELVEVEIEKENTEVGIKAVLILVPCVQTRLELQGKLMNKYSDLELGYLPALIPNVW
ncbi:hypothetical protein SADUNF_Sadunf01G0011200 [Salix dunnii]|uniref:Pentatricopeptide repeat-containing protein n=1 Tax=Salix dunnii TaxID=1413687 RepID=A0A835N9C6_9ROSI|nr:hypothetical protein SADUNF_Sadunf01G0011200 [Salix dunnii]